MMQIADLRSNQKLLNIIDWNMTPEEAVTLYLEWGNNWAHGNYVIRSKDDVSHYFVVNNWGTQPVIYFIRRNSEEAVELARIEMPANLQQVFLESVGGNKGVYALEGEVKQWLKDQLQAG